MNDTNSMKWEKELEEILDGIDRQGIDGFRGGWWEVSTGAEFGEEKLEEVKVFIRKLLESQDTKERRERLCEEAESTVDKGKEEWPEPTEPECIMKPLTKPEFFKKKKETPKEV